MAAFRALVLVGDHQLDAREAPREEPAQQLAPEGPGLRGPHVQGDHLAVARLVHGIGHDQGLAAHAPVGPAHPLHLGVQPQIGIATLERPLAEGRHLLIQGGADPRDLGLAQASDPQLLDHPLDLPGRHTVHAALHDHGHQGLLASGPGLQEAGEVGALAELGDE
jgi:hypothetical protein